MVVMVMMVMTLIVTVILMIVIIVKQNVVKCKKKMEHDINFQFKNKK